MLYRDTREELLRILAGLLADGLLDRGGGALSARPHVDHMVITTTGSQFKRWQLDEKDFILLDLEGNIVEQCRALGPAGTPVHLALYRMFPECRAVVHTHAPFSLAFSSLNASIPSTTFQMDVLGEVPCILTDDNAIKARFANNPDAHEVDVPAGMVQKPAVAAIGNAIVAGINEKLLPRHRELQRHGLAFTTFRHGLYVFARSMEEAADNLFRVEASARNAVLCANLRHASPPIA